MFLKTLLLSAGVHDGKTGWLGKASSMRFAGRHPRVTRLGSVTNCRGLFDIVVIMTFVVERGSGNLCRATQTVFEYFIADPGSFLSRNESLRSHSAYLVL